MSLRENIFNYRLSRVRRIIENGFEIFASRFTVFQKPISLFPETANLVILACCALHYYLKTTCGPTYLPPGSVDDENHNAVHIIPGSRNNNIGNAQGISNIIFGMCSNSYINEAGKLKFTCRTFLRKQLNFIVNANDWRRIKLINKIFI